MDYKKLYTPTEATALYNIMKIKYDPTSYSLRSNLITSDSATSIAEEHIANFNYDAEKKLAEIIAAKQRRKIKNITGTSGREVPERREFSDMSLVCVQQDNLHICLDLLKDIVDLPNIKKTNIMQTLIAMCVALSSTKSCAKEMFLLCVSEYNTLKYSDAVSFEWLKTRLRDVLNPIPLISNKCSVDVTYVPSRGTVDDTLLASDDQAVDSLVGHFISMFEVVWAWNSLPEDLKNCFIALCSISETSKFSFKFYAPFVELTSTGFKITPDLEKAISEKDPEKRYEEYQNIIKASGRDIYAHCATYYKTDVDKNCFINPIPAIYTSYVLQLGLTNLRINYLRILYEFCVTNKYLSKSDVKSDLFEKITTFGGLGTTLSGTDAPETHSKALMDLSSGHTGIGKAPDVKDTGHESPALFAALDKLSDSFSAGMYEYDVHDVIEDSEHCKVKYNTIANKISLVNKLLIRRIKNIKTYNTGGKNPGRPSGKLDRKTLYRYKYDPNIFYDNTYKTKESDLAFGIILDESGSMAGRGIEDGRITMVVLHETLKALGINHCIIGHTSDAKHHCELARYQSFKEDKTYRLCKNYALVSTVAKRGNCDSAALYYMEKAFSRVRNKDKICLVFSDGAPTECTGTELKDQVRAMERKGIKVIGIGINFKSIAKYYTDYANGRNLSDMLDIVANILEEYVLKKKDT